MGRYQGRAGPLTLSPPACLSVWPDPALISPFPWPSEGPDSVLLGAMNQRNLRFIDMLWRLRRPWPGRPVGPVRFLLGW